MRLRRRVLRERRAGSGGAAQAHVRREVERGQQRILWWAAGAASVVLALLVGSGYYFGSYRPPRQVVAQVGARVFQLRDVLPMTRIAAVAQASQGGGVDPRQALEDFLRVELLIQQAPELGVALTQEEISAELVRRFDPTPPDATPAADLSPEARKTFDRFLTAIKVPEEIYLDSLQGDLLLARVTDFFRLTSPVEAEQVRLRWIAARDSANAEEALRRLRAGEPFEVVAAAHNIDRTFAGTTGEVGWIPRGAFPELDNLVFVAGAPDFIGPVQTSLGPMVIQVVAGPENQPVDGRFREVLTRRAADGWFTAQVTDHVSRYRFDAAASAWVIGRLR